MEQHRQLISTKADTLFALKNLIHESTIEEMLLLILVKLMLSCQEKNKFLENITNLVIESEFLF